MNINRPLTLPSPRNAGESNAFELHHRSSTPTRGGRDAAETSTSEGASLEVLVHQAAGTVQRITRQSATVGEPSGDSDRGARLWFGASSANCGESLQAVVANIGRTCVSAARQFHRNYVTLLARFHYSVLATEDEREAYTRHQNNLIRFRNSALSKMSGPSLLEAIESYDDCLARMRTKGFGGPIQLVRHPFAEFIAKRNSVFPPQGRYDLLDDIESLKRLCKDYQERIDDRLGTPQELNSGEYADSLKAACFLWQRGIKYREALREVQKWEGVLLGGD